MNKIYTGIGSRSTPNLILEAFKTLGKQLAEEGYTLRSGRAEGADSYFEIGARDAKGNCEIFLPWDGFSGNASLSQYPAIVLPTSGELYNRAKESVIDYHPAPSRLNKGGMKLMARNYLQIYGTNTENPILSDFVICYTVDGKASGGTGQALRIAEDLNIPIFNAFGYETKPNEFVTDVLNNVL